MIDVCPIGGSIALSSFIQRPASVLSVLLSNSAQKLLQGVLIENPNASSALTGYIFTAVY